MQTYLISTDPPKYLCAKCFKSLQSERYIRCKICAGKFHFICTDIISEVNVIDAVKPNKNIVFNCNECLLGSSDLVASFTALSLEVRELKLMLKEFIDGSNENKKANNTGLTASNAHSNSLESGANMPSSNIQKQSIESNVNLSAVNGTASLPIPISIPACSNVPNVDACVQTTDAANKSYAHSLISTDVVADAVHDNIAVVADVSQPSDGGSHYAALTVAKNSGNVQNQVNIPANNAKWVDVVKKKNRRKAVIGESENSDLDVVVQRKWVHLSTFKPSVSPENIIAYVAKYIDISDNHMVCFRLVKKDTDFTKLKSINFKLGIAANFYGELFKPSLWPAHVRVRPFHNFQQGLQGMQPA